MNILNSNIEKNFEHNFLREVSFCPVCHSKKKKFLLNKNNQEIGNLYLSQLSKYLNIELFQLLRKLQTYECKNCSTIYCDPWLKAEVSNEFYSSVYGKHQFGWAEFDKWANNDETNNILGNRKSIWKFIKKFLKKIDYYAELNCPFQGLFPMFAKNFFEMDNSFKSSRIRHILEMRRIYSSKEDFSGVTIQKKEYGMSSVFPTNNFLITQESSMFWGSNCTFNNVSCHNTASSVFGVKKLPLNEIETLKFDVFGSFGNIDHVSDPLKVIKKMLKHSKLVVLTLHNLKSNIHKQHLYKFGPKFPDFLKNQGINVFKIPLQETAINLKNRESAETILLSTEINFK